MTNALKVSTPVLENTIFEPAIAWHGIKLGQPDWSEDSHSLAFTLSYRQYGELLHMHPQHFLGTAYL